ncbi:MAG: hypothetical protein ACP5HQ_00280 [Thermoprotei archaeon]
MANVKIPKEWYDILYKLSRDKRVGLGELLREIASSEGECLNLPEVKLSGEFKRISVNFQVDEERLISRLREFLFCVNS